MNVLFPTDFSENAELACHYAFDIAQKSGGTVTVLNAYDLPYSDRGLTTSLLEVIKENAEKNMAKFEKQLSHYTAPFTTEVKLGNPIRLIKDFASKSSIDMIVMGTKGASGLEQILIGSNAASVIQNTKKPALIIPPNSSKKEFKKMVFASDFNLKHQEDNLQQLAFFAQLNQTQIDVLHVQSDSGSAVGSRQMVKEILGSLLKEFTIANSPNIEEAINLEAEKEEADVIAVVSKSYGFFEKLFHNSLSSKLAYHTKLPLLVLHEPN